MMWSDDIWIQNEKYHEMQIEKGNEAVIVVSLQMKSLEMILNNFSC